MESNSIHIEAEERTPFVKGDVSTGELVLRGRSYPEDAKGFYTALKEWFDHFLANSNENIKIDLDLEYINTATTVFINNMIREIAQFSNQKNITVNWYYDTDDIEMEDIGKDFKRILGDHLVLKEREVEHDL